MNFVNKISLFIILLVACNANCSDGGIKAEKVVLASRAVFDDIIPVLALQQVIVNYLDGWLEDNKLASSDKLMNKIIFSNNSKFLASSSDEGSKIKIWDCASGKLLNTITGDNENGENKIVSLVFSPDDKYLASGYGDQIRIHDYENGILTKTLSGNMGIIMSLAYSKNGKLLASGSQVVKLWDLDTKSAGYGKCIAMLVDNNTKSFMNLAFSHDDLNLASVSFDGTAKIWDVISGKLLLDLRVSNQPVTSVAYSLNKIITGSLGSEAIKIWDPNTGNLLNKIAAYYVRSFAVSLDGKCIAAASSGKLEIWDFESKKLVKNVIFDDRLIILVFSVAFSNNGKYLAAAYDHRDEGNVIKIWRNDAAELNRVLDINDLKTLQ